MFSNERLDTSKGFDDNFKKIITLIVTSIIASGFMITIGVIIYNRYATRTIAVQTGSIASSNVQVPYSEGNEEQSQTSFSNESASEDSSSSVSEERNHFIKGTRYLINHYIPVKTYKQIKGEMISRRHRKCLVSECPICLEPIENNSLCRILTCLHIYHANCI